MARVKKSPQSIEQVKAKPAKTPEAREAYMIHLAETRAEQMMLDGTAPASVICEYLKRGGPKARLQKEKDELELELIKAKTENLKMAQNLEGLFKEAMAAFTDYRGSNEEEDVDEFED